MDSNRAHINISNNLALSVYFMIDNSIATGISQMNVIN